MKLCVHFKMLLLFLLLGLSGKAYAQIILSESFEKFSEGTASIPGKILENLDPYTQMSGWIGNEVYPAGGVAKMGGSKKLGSISTPVLNLSEPEAIYTLQFKAAAWINAKESTSLKIFVDNNLVYTAEGLNNSDGTYIAYKTEIRGTAASRVRFEGMSAEYGRFFLDDVVIIKTSAGQNLPAFVMVQQDVKFPNSTVNSSSRLGIGVSAGNLTGDLRLTLSGKGFSFGSDGVVTSAVLKKSDAETGANVELTLTVEDLQDCTGTLTISGGGLEKDIEVSLYCKVVSLSGDGSEENPFTVTDIIKLENTVSGFFWVRGKIAGTIVFNQPSEYTFPFTTDKAIYLADNLSERDSTKLLPVRMKDEIGAALNLKDNPDNLGEEVMINSSLGAYFGMPGLPAPSEFYFTSGLSVSDREMISDRIYTVNGILIIDAFETGIAEVYNILGQKVKDQYLNRGLNEIKGLFEGQVYTVRFNGKSQKIAF